MRGGELASLQESGAEMVRLPCDLTIEILNHDGHSGKFTPGLCDPVGRRRSNAACFAACALEPGMNHRVEPWIHSLHGGNREVDQFGRGNLLGTKQFCLSNGVEMQWLGHIPTH